MARGTVKKILELLPGVDCGGYGGCGYPTCEACAKAIAEGAPVNQCPAANNAAVKKIAKILGVEPVEAIDQVAFIKCAGSAAGKERLKACKSCDEAKKAGFASDECKFGCIGIGSCVDRCKFDAMKVKDGKVEINRRKCTGCMACVTGCAQCIIEMIPREATNFIPCSSKDDEKDTLAKCGYGCIGCGDCAIACPKDAIEMVCGDKVDGRYARIDYSKCEGCVTCTVKCRKKIIVDTLHDLKEAKETVAFVRCVGDSHADKDLKKMGKTSCKDVTADDLASNGFCSYTCAGLGDCVNECRYDAIKVKDGIAVVDSGKCVGCGDCFRACPREKIIMAPFIGVKQVACTTHLWPPEKRMEVCGAGCIACGDCVYNCPSEAISIQGGVPFIDYDKCVNCGVCTYVCSRNLIKERVVPEYNYLQREAIAAEK